MGRGQLTGISLPDNWTSLAGALDGVLDALGHAISASSIMGRTGLAFRAVLPLARDGDAPVLMAAGGGQALFDPALLPARLHRLGLRADVLHAERADRDYSRRRAEAIKRVHKSIDRGTAAIVHDLHLPRFGLVTGYDDRAGLWFVRSLLSGHAGDRLPVDRWPVPERHEPVFVVTITGREKIDQRRAVGDGIRDAVVSYEQGEAGLGESAISGRAALVRWAAAFAAGEPLDPSGNALLVQALQSARRDAADYLRGEATRTLTEHRAPLERAAAAYSAEVLALSRMGTMFPYPSGGDPTNPASRVVAAGALREALAREDEAIAALRDVT